MGTAASASDRSEASRLVSILQNSSSSSDRVTALNKLWEHSRTEKFKAPLCDPSLGFIDLLVRLLGGNPSEDERHLMVCCLCDLSTAPENRAYLGSRQLGLVPVMVRQLQKKYVLTTINNFILCNATHSYLLLPEVGLMSALLNDANNAFSGRCIANFALNLKESDLNLMMSYRPEVAMLTCLRRFTKEQVKADVDGNTAYWALNFFFGWSHFPVAARAIKDLGAVSFIESISSPNCMVGVKCGIILCNLAGREEQASGKRSLLQSSPETFEQILDLFAATLSQNTGEAAEKMKKFKDYNFGIVKMRHIVGSVRTLCISDSNKPLMLNTNVVKMLIETLHLFTSNADVLKFFTSYNFWDIADGGGNDGETAELAIEALLQLSFNYESTEQLRGKFLNASNLNITAILSECVSDPRGKLQSEAKRNASSLLNRLKGEERKAVAAPVAQMSSLQINSGRAAAPQNTKHVMLSYSWAVNKNFVKAFGARLRELGHDVWRDEEGSNVLGPMQGDTDEMMALAIEASYAVVIFVSPQYKESANCRTEAKYAKQRQLLCPLKIVYVMMCENYHTRSNPPVDGWLALNIGTDLWYPLWNESMINSTSQAISDLLGHQQQTVSVNVAASASPAKSITPTPAAPSTAQVDLDLAWSLLSDPANSKDPGGVSTYMQDLGLSSKEDLLDMENSEITDLSNLLKKLKQRQFLKALNKEQ